MKLDIQQFTTLIFDCDGVVLDSNKVKSDAFYKATLPYGEPAARAMVDYHIANGGVSRYKKFDYFVKKIAPEYSKKKELNQESLLNAYADYVRDGLLSCEVAPGLEELRQNTPNARWLIVSGGDEAELRNLFAQRGIAKWFDGGIFGSPATKDEILAREIASGNISKKALFLGDSKYDYQAAVSAGLAFLFVSRWSEVSDWEVWVRSMNIKHVECF